ncbi:MAG TPA: PAS domain S-box protein [Capsulimonadaceae bacterium]|jgi:PAS domain S-box-containing protein
MNETIRVLVIEDNDECYSSMASLLGGVHGSPLSIERVSSFDAASSALAAVDYDACLLSDHVGEARGLDLIYTALVARPDAPIIVISSQDDYASDVAAMEAGAMGYLVRGDLSSCILERSIRYAIHGKRVEATLVKTMSAEHAGLLAAITDLPVGIFVTDPKMPGDPLVFVNKAFSDISTLPPQELLGRSAAELTPEGADEEAIREIERCRAHAETYRGELSGHRLDGAPYTVRLTISPVMNEANETVNFIGLCEDVTEQHAAQVALAKSERRLDRMLSNLPIMIYRAVRRPDGTLKFQYVSDGSIDMVGLSPDALKSMNASLGHLVHPNESVSFENIAKCANENVTSLRWEGRIVQPNGMIRHVTWMAHPEIQDNREIIWDGCMVDVTDRVTAQEEAKLLASIVEGSHDAIIGKTLDGKLTSWNHAAERLYGYTADEMIGQHISLLIPNDRPAELPKILGLIARGEHVKSLETVRCAKDGTLIDVSLTVSPIRDTSGHIIGASSIVQDIRQRKLADLQIQKQLKRIEALRNIDIAITGSLDLRVTLSVLLDQVTSRLNVDCASILLLNTHTQRLEYVAGRGFRTSGISNTHIRLGEGYAGRAALERRTLGVPDISMDPSFVRVPLISGEEFKAYWAVPLITKGRVAGVLELFHRDLMEPDADWFSFLEALGGQAAIAIENADLFTDLQRSNVELEIAYNSTLEGWSKALDLRDHETEGHTRRVTDAALVLARDLDVRGQEITSIYRGSLLHDIGKMGIPDSILLKPGHLSDDEWVVMKKHPVYAYELLSPIPYLLPSLDIPYCHHEKWDGSGYPRGLVGKQIPFSARIFAVVDVWDALRSNRPYREGWPVERVRSHIAAGSGTHFDPQVVDAFLASELCMGTDEPPGT